MNWNPLFLSILAYACSDFLFQSDSFISGAGHRVKKFFMHGALVLITLVFFLHGYQWQTVLVYAALITGIHLIIDWFKFLIDLKNDKTLNLVSFIFHQILQLLSIIIVWSWFKFRTVQGILSFYQTIFSVKTLPSATGIIKSSFVFTPEKLIIGAIIFIYTCFGGAILIDNFLNWIRRVDAAFSYKQERTGKWIGVLERMIVLALIINNALGSVAFIFTAKSIARFGELNDKNFAEYYIIGTFASITLAIAGGFILKYLLTIV